MQIILPFYGQFGKLQVPFFVTVGFQRKLAQLLISMWVKEKLNFYTIVILLSCFCHCPWTVLCAEIL